ncbi:MULTISPECIES: ring-cleaving dioxygenase [unclassified Mesorhizobium]|uniref:ring-cleaving dioxygenase n=1 Tax=unclassified Mesorhizobium TaxID=325217 RepID=UPI0011286DBE|nr:MULTISPECIES: ring-cleaving dioxygenase [unclassified Mesorhizobium]MBZ9958651.1 ring-cleaving dioxygenase [Mesorhizobium sp. BR1-1-14]MBZ9984254.1 ring-cleaving dioxygenase [Mesorhizobium sp. BR-1-1-8]TPI47269.1 ring-cleaving dioxygenase [Mesorhizobium sp. B3-1-1]TPJ48466.1 ring-cleaving dioxygenase [Mesorhizobium sp. B2-6-4]TPJ56872.1 ring-cleaving dioxygenase [Mesorhizobium sp. B2-6-1]
MSLQLTGIHHLTAITANVRGNLHFYTRVLGLRLVKKTVNQDDTSAYHLFYADGEATPGTDLTFFDWPVGRERRGTHSIVRTSLRVGGEDSLAWWKQHLTDENIVTSEIADIGGYASLDFEDPEGQRLRLVSDDGKGDSRPWAQSRVPVEHQIRGLGPIVISVPDLTNTEAVVTQVMNMRKVRDYASPEGQVQVFEMGEGGPAAELHVLVQPGLAPARQGAGAVHHVAFRAPDQETLHQWTARLAEFRLPSSGEVERYYFRSLYFREPNGILFEIATDGPGFTADEPLETLGEKLALPPFLESKRASIEAGLKPLK